MKRVLRKNRGLDHDAQNMLVAEQLDHIGGERKQIQSDMQRVREELNFFEFYYPATTEDPHASLQGELSIGGRKIDRRVCNLLLNGYKTIWLRDRMREIILELDQKDAKLCSEITHIQRNEFMRQNLGVYVPEWL